MVSDVDAGSTYLTSSSIGTAAPLDVGTSANNVVQLDSTAKLPAVDGSQLTNVSAGGGKVLQVLQTVKTDVTSTTSTSAADITGMSVSITPSATTSKILVNFDIQGSADQSSGQNYHVHLVRDSSNIFQGDADGSRVRCTVNGAESDGVGSSFHRSMMYLDSPSSTSAVTYKLQWQVQSGTLYLNREHQDADGAGSGRFVSQITVMEIGA